jgi:hypothetical protein
MGATMSQNQPATPENQTDNSAEMPATVEETRQYGGRNPPPPGFFGYWHPKYTPQKITQFSRRITDSEMQQFTSEE